jgi:phage-related protein
MSFTPATQADSSGESLLYNRDTNFSGIILITGTSKGIKTVTPSYGTRVSFSSNNYSYATDDNYYNLIPLSANSLTAKFDVKYDVSESGARELAYFFEAHSGIKQFEFRTDAEVYQEVSGVCVNYAINHMNNQHYEVAVSVEVLEAPNLFNWSNMNFVSGASSTYAGVVGGSTPASYEKYDVVFTGDHSSNKLNCFFYCTEDHDATAHNSPTGDDSSWSQKFFFEPDQGFQNDVRMDVQEINFKNSHKLRVKTHDNISSFPINYKFSSITTKQLKCMLHFLENKGGYRRFEHQIPSVYNRPKVYYCPEWSHTFKYYNSHDLDVSFIEDPLGVIPTGT